LADATAAGHGRTLKTDLPATLTILALICAWLGVCHAILPVTAGAVVFVGLSVDCV
jgi:hypothetical protein